jgi:hypothetical protein
MGNSSTEFFGLILSILGIGLSAYFGINKLISDRRKIKVILKVQELVLVNTGHRPITITYVRIRMKDDNGWTNHVAKFGNDFPYLVGKPLPAKINDGEMLNIPIDQEYDMELWVKATRGTLKIEVTDAEGNIYRKFEWQ